jgi:ATP-dependent protease ClpP protease subunit
MFPKEDRHMLNHASDENDKEQKPKSDVLLNKLLKIRTLFISDVITKEVADTFMKQLLILADDDPEKPIDVFI